MSRQITLGELLQSLGRIDPAAFSALLLQHANVEQPLGAFLVEQEVITEDTLESAIALQEKIQPSIASVIERCLKGESFDLSQVRSQVADEQRVLAKVGDGLSPRVAV